MRTQNTTSTTQERTIPTGQMSYSSMEELIRECKKEHPERGYYPIQVGGASYLVGFVPRFPIELKELYETKKINGRFTRIDVHAQISRLEKGVMDALTRPSDHLRNASLN